MKTKRHIVNCSQCGFELETDSTSERSIYKTLRENMITCSLFGCPKCQAEIKKQLIALRPKEERI